MSTAATLAITYDAVPYPSHPIGPSHPDRMAAVAKLFGMEPPDPRHARILELGCGAGGNLLPIAETLPDASLVGIDLSARQVKMAEALIAAAGLTNAAIQCQSILDFHRDKAPFDYIIAHGIYSWVPHDVQRRMLELCREVLSPNGIAYISYNTYPGWHLQGMLRDLLQYRTRKMADPHTRIKQSRAVLDRLGEAFDKANNVYATMLHAHVEVLRKLNDAFLLHDHLAPDNEPLYFYEFNARAEAVGLQFLGEANFSDMYTGSLSPRAQQTLNSLADGIIELEQYIDFFCNRTLRRTLLCKQGIVLDRKLTHDRIQGLYLSAHVRPEKPEPDIASGNAESFVSTSGHEVNSSEPIVKAALVELGRIWPKSITFEELLDVCTGRLGKLGRAGDHEADARVLGDGLLHGAAGGMVDVRANSPAITTDVNAQPAVAPLARAQMSEASMIANRRHEPVQLSEYERFVLVRADGTQSVDNLVQSVVKGVQDKTLQITVQGQGANRSIDLEAAARQSVNTVLAGAARSALLVA